MSSGTMRDGGRCVVVMTSPDYAWWHGFYEVKHRLEHIVQRASDLRNRGKDPVYTEFPGTYQKEQSFCDVCALALGASGS